MRSDRGRRRCARGVHQRVHHAAKVQAGRARDRLKLLAQPELTLQHRAHESFEALLQSAVPELELVGVAPEDIRRRTGSVDLKEFPA